MTDNPLPPCPVCGSANRIVHTSTLNLTNGKRTLYSNINRYLLCQCGHREITLCADVQRGREAREKEGNNAD